MSYSDSKDNVKGLIKSVQKSLKILYYILLSSHEVSIKEIQNEFGYNSSTIHHILKTLMYEGFVSQNMDTRKYKIGFNIFNAFMQCDYLEKYFSKAYNILEEIVDEIGETTSLFIKRGNRAVCVNGKESPKTLRAFLQVGRNIPLHSTATGKVFLAYMNSDEIHDYIKKVGLQKYFSNTIDDEKKLIIELEEVRKNGYSFELEEYEEQINAVGVPIMDNEGQIISVMTSIGPSTRMSTEKMEYISKVLKEKAKEISESLINLNY